MKISSGNELNQYLLQVAQSSEKVTGRLKPQDGVENLSPPGAPERHFDFHL
jgi:hypothetical protein